MRCVLAVTCLLCSALGEVIVDIQTPLRLEPKINFYLQELRGVGEGEDRQVILGIEWENATSQPLREYSLSVETEDPKILEIVNASSLGPLVSSEGARNVSFSVRGRFLGYTKVIVRERSKEWTLKVSVVRKYSVLVDVVTAFMAALVAFNYVNMGVQLDLHSIAGALKRPVGPSIGFICQFLFMPLASYGIGLVLLDDISLRLGLFTLGCSPGGSMSNFWTLLFDGDVNLSVTMTFISTIAALAMMPLWIFTLGSSLFRDGKAVIPFVNLAGSLIVLTLPVGVGLLIRQHSPRLTRLSERIIRPFTIVCVLVGVSVGLYANSFVFYLFKWQVILAGLSIAWGGYCFGALVAWLFRLKKSQIIAVSIETAFQNPAVAFVMLVLSLPQPDADLSSVPVIAQLMLTGLPMWILLLSSKLYKKLFSSEKAEIETVQRTYSVLQVNPQEEMQEKVTGL